MKASILLFASLFILCFITKTESQDLIKKDSLEQNQVEAEVEPDRNEGGIGVPRGLVKTSDNLSEGYILLNPPNSASVYLINRAGEVVHEWKGNYRSFMSYLTDSGTVVRNAVDPDAPRFYGGGNAGRVQEISWEGDMLWDFEYASDDHLTHHDIEILPNGNILAIAWEHKSREEALGTGRDPDYTPVDGLWPDKVIEIKPVRPNGGRIVWEWHIWDHLIQDYNPKFPNYGDPSAHPELLDINASPNKPEPMHPDTLKLRKRAGRGHPNQTIGSNGCDVYHINAIDYNAELDQIALSSPELGEIFIIDHSTSTEEAAGHTGGRWGKGGDILYRWGNPQNYGRGDSTDQRLYFQHDVRWVDKGFPGEGNLTIYNNDIPNGPDSLNYSAIFELIPPREPDGSYSNPETEALGPENPHWVYLAQDTVSFYSSFVSGAYRMGNGNTFITTGAGGRLLEVTSDGEIVWEYWNPYRGDIRRSDGTAGNPGDNSYMLFRASFIPANHAGLKGRELIPLDPQPEVFTMPPKSEN